MSMWSVAIPVERRASSLAWSNKSRGIMQVSTTAMAMRVEPSSRTRQRAWSVSLARLAVRSVNIALTTTG